MSHLIDTDWVIDYFQNIPDAVQVLDNLIPATAYISIITYTELYEGVYMSRDPKHGEQILRAFLQGVEVLPISRSIAKRNARLRGELRRQRRPVNHRAFDLLIAATALTHDLTLVTRNLRDYEDIPDLRLYRPS